MLLLISDLGQAQAPKPVVVAQVTEAEIKTGLKIIGDVHPIKKSTIGSAVDGRVQHFLVNSGQAVEKGQTIASLRTQTLEIEQAAAVAELALAKQRFAELDNGSRPEDIAEAEANMRAAQASFKNAESKLKRVKSLITTNAASASELDDAKEQAQAARFALDATTALHDRIKVGPRPELIAQAQAQVNLQTEKLNLIKDRIKKFNIVAPFSGFVSAEFTEVGAWIKQGDPIVELIQMNEVEVQASVSAEIAVNLTKDTTLRIEFPDLPDELFTAKIDRLIPLSTTRARTFPVIIKLKNRFNDKTPLLLGGMLARVDFPAGKQEILPLVPKDALVLNGSQRYVFVIDEREGKSIARKVDVELGVALNDRIQIRGDLKVGDRVVVVGNERLVPNSEVKIVSQPAPKKQ